ncbi:MAG: hypothetical protein QGG25_06400 [Phycisphaerae bacterium]|nr:hypothetical protein [Phycisphaerae bacterium]
MNNEKCLRRPGLLQLGCLALMVVAIVAPSLQACQTPVFRYALEKWPGDYYPLLIYHDAPLGDEDKAVADWLDEVQETEGTQVSVYVLDVSKPVTTQPATQPTTQATTQPEQSPADAQRASLLKRFPPPAGVAMPVMVLRYPARPGPKGATWPVVHSGPLDGKLIKSAIDSPVRKKVAKRLLSGDSAVWVLLESGDKAKDDAAAKTLETELARMNKELELPEQAPTPEPDGYEEEGVEIELKVAFTVLRVSRSDPAEAMFIKMLLGSEEGLDEGKEPVAFPIFGRGRALAGFVGKEIEPENIEDACIFLIGRCSCQVKNLNPGTDMLFSVDWDAALAGQEMMTMPDPPKFITDEVDAQDVTLATTQPFEQDAVVEGPSGNLLLVIAISLIAVAVVVGVPMVRVMRKEAGR